MCACAAHDTAIHVQQLSYIIIVQLHADADMHAVMAAAVIVLILSMPYALSSIH